jgi:glycosyltransferase involved in cell wall biosynthesis
MEIIPVAVSGIYGQLGTRSGEGRKVLRRIIPVAIRTRIRQLVAPFSFPSAVNILRDMIEHIRPELIHAMRIPYEGMVASIAMRRISSRDGNVRKTPFLISVWGNDFTLHAKSTPAMSSYTRQTIQNCDGLLTDCRRDRYLAVEWGFDATKPNIVLPGAGGIQLDIFYPLGSELDTGKMQSKTDAKFVTIINPRGIRAYVRNDTFFRAIPLVIDKYPDVHFICPGMSGEEQAQRWVLKMGIGDKVELLPPRTRQQMAELFRKSQISLSITTHDGTPNTLLEAMACGCLPIAGDIESVREWITPGVNGLLVDPADSRGLADAILKAISQPELRDQARERNLELVKERAEYGKCMGMAEEFYERLISKKSGLS